MSKSRKLKAWLIAVVMVLSLFAAMPITAAANGGTDGTTWDGNAYDFALLDPVQPNSETNPYIIDTAGKLAKLAVDVNGGNAYSGEYFQLAANLDLAGLPWTPIGTGANPFQGTFDGNGHTIAGLFIDSYEIDYIGLFGLLGEDAELASLTLAGVDVTGRNLVGALAGTSKGTISGCSVSSGTVSGTSGIGGLVGKVENGLLEHCHAFVDVAGTNEGAGGLAGYVLRTSDIGSLSIFRCSATGSVSGVTRVGGLVGLIQGAACEESFATGTVTGTSQYIGGLAGMLDSYNSFTSAIRNCYAQAEIIAEDEADQVGGLTGDCAYGNLEYCYAASEITAENAEYVGGLTGTMEESAVITSCFYDMDVSGQSDDRGTPKTTSAMKALDTYAGWDFPLVWTLSSHNGGYPALAWQGYSHISLQTVTDLVIEDAIAPIIDGTPVTTIAETDQYTGTISWAGNPETFSSSAYYVATITLTPKAGYTFEGIGANAFEVPSAASATNAAGSGVITAAFYSPPSGYITDGNGCMAYRPEVGEYDDGFDIMGTYDGRWMRTTYSDDGYGTIIAVNGGEPEDIYYDEVGTTVEAGDGVTIRVQPEFYGGGRFLRIIYTLRNTGSRAATVSFGSHADIMIGDDDYAPIYVIQDGRGFKMVNNSDGSIDKGAQFNFFGLSTIGVTDVDTYWFGRYSYRYENIFNQIADTELVDTDSGMAYSWQDKTLAPGQTRTFAVLIGIGDAQSGENVPIGVNFDSQGGSEVASIIVPYGNSITLPPSPHRSGYTFGGWYTEPECVHPFDFSTPITATITLYAKWTEFTPSPGGVYTPPKYPVTTAGQDDPSGGQAAVSKARAEAGETVVITVTPENGYEATITVVDKDGNAVAVTDNGNGTFSFVMPAGGVTVETGFNKIDYFDDVSAQDWFDEAAWYCAANGLMQGTAPRQFDGHLDTNRAMLVTVLYRLASSTDSLESIFDDVEAGMWYTDAVAWAGHNGIVDGYGNGLFGPDDPLTREQMVSILYRYARLMNYDISGLSDLNAYADKDTVSPWALEAMQWAVGNGILEGVDTNLLAPQMVATRAQFAAILQRYITTIVK